MWALVAILLLLWLIGLLASMTFGGMIHVLLALAVVVAIWNVFSRKKRRYARY